MRYGALTPGPQLHCSTNMLNWRDQVSLKTKKIINNSFSRETLLSQFCNVSNPPTDPWKWLLKWAGDESKDMRKLVSRFQICEDDELGFMATLVGSILKVTILYYKIRQFGQT